MARVCSGPSSRRNMILLGKFSNSTGRRGNKSKSGCSKKAEPTTEARIATSNSKFNQVCITECFRRRIIYSDLQRRNREYCGSGVKRKNGGHGDGVEPTKDLTSKNTPLMQEPLSPEVGWLGVGSVTQDILNGDYVSSEAVSAFTVNFISGLARNDKANLDEPDNSITPKLWTDYWKSAKERTSSASEILHFGVFKAGARHSIIAEFDARMTNSAMQSGFSPK
jgi:hypothetical protein